MWYALQTRPGQERLSQRVLVAKGYEAFLPTFNICKTRKDRNVDVEKVLFPGYVFCRFSNDAVGMMITTPGVIRIVGCGPRGSPITEVEISSIQRLIRAGIARQPWQYLPVGCRVRIQSGPLMGIEGIIVSGPGSRRLIVTVTLLQRSVAAVLEDGTALELLHNSERVDSEPLTDIESFAVRLAKRTEYDHD